jgi:hypothetical protein
MNKIGRKSFKERVRILLLIFGYIFQSIIITILIIFLCIAVPAFMLSKIIVCPALVILGIGLFPLEAIWFLIRGNVRVFVIFYEWAIKYYNSGLLSEFGESVWDNRPRFAKVLSND